MRTQWGRRPVTVVAGVVAVAGVVWLWWKGVPDLYRHSGAGADARVQSEAGTRLGLVIGLACAGVVGVLWLNTRTLQLVQLGQHTDRYARAVDQLGSETVDVRLGGIFALEQLAAGSRRDRDQATIVELLGAFTRVHSDPLHQWRHLPFASATPSRVPDELSADAKNPVERQVRPPADVQAAVTVLGRLAGAVAARGDLSGAYLRGAVLSGATFDRVNFTGAGLAHADFTGANLAGAVLADTDLTNAVLAGADLTGADLTGADLTGADLTGADLTGARLTAAVLVAAILIDATLAGTELSCADLSNAYLNGADLTGADVSDANLTGADLTGAGLGRARLSRACLIEAILRGADLTGTELTAVELAGANLTSARALQQHQLNRARGSGDTILPDELVRPAHWSRS